MQFSCFSQQADSSSLKELDEVIISAYKNESVLKTPLNIKSIYVDSMSKYGNYNITDLLARTEGVSMLTTGIAIAKPVVRGLYGNRLVILLNGLKFDNQQWQEEHGLGLTTVGISRVELIKGPISVLYGSEAMGGIINLIEDGKGKPGTKESDFRISFNSNTMGGMMQAGYKETKQNSWWRIRIGSDNNADYSDGNNKRILNSRFDGYYIKSAFGFERKRISTTINYSSSFNRFGFIFNDAYSFIEEDTRWSRRLNVNPAHLVLLNILSADNKISINDKLKLNVNIGVQSNERMENEGGGAISLNMHLLTTQYLLKLQYEINEKNKLVISNLNSYEVNTNYGARKIVPDARMQESNVSLNLETNLSKHLVFENGLGAGEKYIRTKETPTVNMGEKEITPFTKFSPYYNVFTGLSFFPASHFNIKANVSTGVRVANLAELSSDGLHEGIFTYEIGNPLLKNEQIFSGNLLVNFMSKYLDLSVTPFYNYFYNYIYLTPVNESWYGFPVYRYKQQDAIQYGTEAYVTIKPTKSIEIKTTYSGMISQTADGNYTPYIPAQKIAPLLTYKVSLKNNMFVSCYTGVDYCLAQNLVAPFEIKTPEYLLWNAGSSVRIRGKNQYDVGFSVNNILNTAYYDHLSRFKNYGLLNAGRNVSVNVKILLK